MTSRNKRYEDKKRAKGLIKKTVWIPEECSVEFQQMADFCTEHRGYIPFMVRSLVTGKMKKAI